jgi:predicted DNA-binding protein
MTINISAHIEEDLAQKLEQVAEFEGRSKSYYIKKGLTDILEQKFRDMQDLLNAQKTMKEVKDSGEGFVSFDEVFKGVK